MDASRAGRLGNRRAALWWMGWHPLTMAIVGGFAGVSAGNLIAVPLQRVTGLTVFTTDATFGVAGILLGVLGWYLGTGVVNAHYEQILESFRTGVSPPGSDVVTYAILGDQSGSKPLIRPPPSYETTFLVLDGDAMEVHEGALALDDRRRAFGDASVTIPYGEVKAVEATDASLVVETAHDDRFAFTADRKPTAAVRAIRDRVEATARSGDGQQPAADD